MNQTALREAVAAALGDIPEVVAGDWTVLAVPVDALEPPAFMLRWGPDPWREPQAFCTDLARLEVICVADRLTPEANYPILEQMTDAAHVALSAVQLRPNRLAPPGPFEIAQVTYLAARWQIVRPIDTGAQ
jgi:hypothetical protein